MATSAGARRRAPPRPATGPRRAGSAPPAPGPPRARGREEASAPGRRRARACSSGFSSEKESGLVLALRGEDGPRPRELDLVQHHPRDRVGIAKREGERDRRTEGYDEPDGGPFRAGPHLDVEHAEERRVGKGVDLGGRRIIKKK